MPRANEDSLKITYLPKESCPTVNVAFQTVFSVINSCANDNNRQTERLKIIGYVKHAISSSDAGYYTTLLRKIPDNKDGMEVERKIVNFDFLSR